MGNSFKNRHIGITPDALTEMMDVLKVNSIDQLINETIPENIRTKEHNHFLWNRLDKRNM